MYKTGIAFLLLLIMLIPESIIAQGYATAMSILTENKDKLVKLAEQLIAQETLEGDELEKVFVDMGVSTPPPKVKPTTVPVPVQPVGEGETIPQPKKAPGVPQFVPKPNPSPSD